MSDRLNSSVLVSVPSSYMQIAKKSKRPHFRRSQKSHSVPSRNTPSSQQLPAWIQSQSKAPVETDVVDHVDESIVSGDQAFSSLPRPIQRALTDKGYKVPTPIQEKSISPFLEGRDLVACSQTGTGKTAAFVLPLLSRLSREKSSRERIQPLALILAPTRELAQQIESSIRDYGKYLTLKHTVVVGGVSQHRQARAIRDGVDILVATPGRLLDLMSQRLVDLRAIKYVILDEADRMLDMGFLPDIKKIMAPIPKARQTVLFSATYPPQVSELVKIMVVEPVRISITPEKPAVERIRQRVIFVERAGKDDLLAEVLQTEGVDRAIVFTKMKHAADRIVRKLDRQGIRAVAIHGNKSQSARENSLQKFRVGETKVLVATDIAARGLDIKSVSHVINYDLPMEPENYVHRIGRTARAGAGGDAVSFCSDQERAQLRGIERLIKLPLVDPSVEKEKFGSNVGRGNPRGNNPPERRSQRPKAFRSRRRNRGQSR